MREKLEQLNSFLVLLQNMPELFDDVVKYYEMEEDYEACAIAMQAKSMVDNVKHPLYAKIGGYNEA
jgi:hypothetical protein